MIFKDEIGFYTVNDICRILNIGRATFYRLLDDPDANFPPSSKLTSKDKAQPKWWIPYVHAWIRVKLQAWNEANVTTATPPRSAQTPPTTRKPLR